MKLALLLHIYQPPTQFPNVLKIITERSYSKITEILKRYPQARITLNIPAALLVQLGEHGYTGLITDLTDLVRRGQVELTGSAAWHPLLFKLPEAEIIRQIRLNEEINQRFFGDLWAPRGFFPPEMAVDERVLGVIEECGYERVVLENPKSQSAPGGPNPKNAVFKRRGGKLKILFRDREASLGVAFGKITTVKDFLEKRSSDFSRDKKRSSEFTRDPNRTSNFSCDEGIAGKPASSRIADKSATSKRSSEFTRDPNRTSNFSCDEGIAGKPASSRIADKSATSKRSSEFTRDPNRTSNFSCDEGIAGKPASSRIADKSATSKRSSALARDSSCLLLALDGETFGWHRPGQLGFLEELFQAGEENPPDSPTAGKTSAKENLQGLKSPTLKVEELAEVKEAVSPRTVGPVELVTVSEFACRLPVGPEIRVGKTSWGTREEQDGRIFYPRWEDPDNEIHQLQWELTDLAIRSVNKSSFNKSINQKFGLLDHWVTDLFEAPPIPQPPGKPRRFPQIQPPRLRRRFSSAGQWLKARKLLDRALHSDQYFWAGGKSAWHPEMVERGARMLKDVVLSVPDVGDGDRQKARDLYGRIVETGKRLHGEIVIC